MKIVALMLSAFLSFFPGQPGPMSSIHGQSLPTLEGNTVSLSSYADKKILLVSLPVVSQDSGLTAGLTSFYQQYGPQVVIIGLLPGDLGVDLQQGVLWKQRLAAAQVPVVLSAPLQVQAGSGQTAVISWLTDHTRNGHYNVQIQGGGYKFFVDERGGLYAVMGPRQSLTAPIMDKIATRPLPAAATNH